MRTPPLLLGGGLILWGLQTDFIWFAVAMAFLLEVGRFTDLRWDFTLKDLERVWDLCGLLFAGGLIYFYASDEVRTAFAFAQWQPFFFFPMVLAYCFGTRDQVELRVFSWFLRRRLGGRWAHRTAGFGYPYFAICVLSASATNLHKTWFYFCAAGLLGYALWCSRPRRIRLAAWLGLISIVVVSGFFGHHGLQRMQSVVEGAAANWFAKNFSRRGVNSKESRTSIGALGKLKLSGKIVYRVDPDPKSAPPSLLREVSYNSFRRDTWFASNREFGKLEAESLDHWEFFTNKTRLQGATVAGVFSRGKGILPLPTGTAIITNLQVADLFTNRMGAVRVENGVNLLSYHIQHGPGESIDTAPDPEDLFVPRSEEEAIEAVLPELGIDVENASDREKMQAVARFFINNFSYSTHITTRHIDRSGRVSPLGMFLTENRTGHCEYFATATVLMLRKLGVPARYATGFAVQETAPKGRRYIVRERHAHAWALVQHDGAWHDFDTTPASWEGTERKDKSAWEPLSDWLSRGWFEFSKWRYAKTNYRIYLLWALVPLILLLVWRLAASQRKKRAREKGLASDFPIQGADSEFYAVEDRLRRFGLVRRTGEALGAWAARVREFSSLNDLPLEPLITLHYRYRFDPQGLQPTDREKLRRLANEATAAIPEKPVLK